MTERYKRTMNGSDALHNPTPEETARGYQDWSVHQNMRSVGASWKGWKIKEERLSPEGDEAQFKGVLESDDAAYKSGSFTLRVLKEKEGARWRIDSFTAVGDRK